MKPKVYVETSVISYLTARPSRDLMTAAQQQVTSEWWEERRTDYDLYVSTVVVEEISQGDPNANIIKLTALLIKKKALPEKAVEDAYHIAIACVHQMQYLITWNYKHIANATMREAINDVCREAGYHPPVICTITELGDENVE